MKNTIYEQLLKQTLVLLPTIPQISSENLGYFSCGEKFYAGAKKIIVKHLMEMINITEAQAVTWFEEFFKNDNEDDYFVEWKLVPVFLKLISKTDESAAGADDGAITVLAYGGTEPYAYDVDSGTPQATGVFTGLADGDHVVTVTDDDERTTSLTINIAAGA